MAESAYIKLAENSDKPSVTLDEVKDQLLHYKEQLSLTGRQLGWDYAEAAFPYTIEQKSEGEGVWFYLKGKNELYRYIVMGVGRETAEDGAERTYVQVVLPDGSTIGDKNKGNEFCKYLGKVWKAEVHLFNGRVIYYNKQK